MKKMTFFFLISLSVFACKERDDKPKNNNTNVVPKAGAHFVKGNSSAPISIDYFADLECGACKAMSPVLDQILAKYPNDVKIVFRHFPKDLSCNSFKSNWNHEHACEAHVAAVCVGKIKDKFWEFKDHLFANQSVYNDANFKTWATQNFGLSAGEYDNCIKDPAIMSQIKADINDLLGRKIPKGQQGVGTPTIYINNSYRIFPASQQLIENAINTLKSGKALPVQEYQ